MALEAPLGTKPRREPPTEDKVSSAAPLDGIRGSARGARLRILGQSVSNSVFFTIRSLPPIMVDGRVHFLSNKQDGSHEHQGTRNARPYGRGTTGKSVAAPSGQ